MQNTNNNSNNNMQELNISEDEKILQQSLKNIMHDKNNNIDIENNVGEKIHQDTKINEISSSYTLTSSKKYGINIKSIILGAVSIIAGAVAINIFMSKAQSNSQAQANSIPDTDKSKVAIVDKQEKANRDKVNIKEADIALQNGQTMQGEIYLQNTNAIPTQQLPIIDSANSNNINTSYGNSGMIQPQIIQPMPSLPAPPPISPEDKEIDTKIKSGILQQAQGIIGTQHSGYTSISYAKSNQSNSNNSTTNQNNSNTNNIANKDTQKIIFKAGDILYATLITQVDTDDSTNVLATIYGGAYDQATLIGQVNINPNNINIQFNQLSPKDRTKKSLAIKAIAIREQDAKQGVADKIDNHTFERYSYLFAASMLKAFGKAAEGATQTTIGLGGAIVQSQEKVTNTKEIAKQGLGEIGTTMGGEVRRKFNRPPTYTIPANQGIGIIFTQDILEERE